MMVRNKKAKFTAAILAAAALASGYAVPAVMAADISAEKGSKADQAFYDLYLLNLTKDALFDSQAFRTDLMQMAAPGRAALAETAQNSSVFNKNGFYVQQQGG